jgi:hypothetical protein
MRKMLKFSALLLVLGLVLGLTGCPDDGGGNDDIFKENTSGRLLTDNLGAEDLVLFYNTVRSANLLGGLPGNADKFKIKLPDSNKMYVIYAVRYSDYKGKSSAEVQNIKVIDSALVYSDPLNETSCRIGDPKAGGTAEIKFTNQTIYFVEVGKGSANDENLFYVMRPNSTESVFTTPETDGFTVYMTLNLPIKKNGKITGVQRRFIDEWTDVIVPQTGRVSNVLISNVNIAAAAPNYHEGYLRIVNNSGRGYRVRNGAEAISSTLGFSAIQNGDEQVWELRGENTAPGRPYATFYLEAGSATYNLTISQFHIQNGYKYTLYINPDSAAQKYTISEGTPLDPETEEIVW